MKLFRAALRRVKTALVWLWHVFIIGPVMRPYGMTEPSGADTRIAIELVRDRISALPTPLKVAIVLGLALLTVEILGLPRSS